MLELKFTGTYPRWMQELVASCDLYRICMAKYVHCVVAMGPRSIGRWSRATVSDNMRINSSSSGDFSLPRYSGGGLGRGFGDDAKVVYKPPPQPSPGVPGEGVKAAEGGVPA